MPPQLTPLQRRTIVDLRESGCRISDIKRLTGISRPTINFWLKRNQETGGDMTTHYRKDYKRATTAEQDAAIVAAHLEQPFLSTQWTATHFNVTKDTVRRRLKESGLILRKSSANNIKSEPLLQNLDQILPGELGSSSPSTDGLASRKALHAEIICTHKPASHLLQLNKTIKSEGPKVYRPSHALKREIGAETCCECNAIIPVSCALARCVQCAEGALFCAQCLHNAHSHTAHALMQLPDTRTYRILESIFQQLRLDVNELLSKEYEDEEDEELDESHPGQLLEVEMGPVNANVQLDEPLVPAPRPAPYLTLSDMRITQDLTNTAPFDPLHSLVKQEMVTDGSESDPDTSEANNSIADCSVEIKRGDSTDSDAEDTPLSEFTPTKRKANSDDPGTSKKRNANKTDHPPFKVVVKQEPLPPDEEESKDEPEPKTSTTKRKAKRQRPGTSKKRNANKEAAVERHPSLSEVKIKQEPVPEDETPYETNVVVKLEPTIHADDGIQDEMENTTADSCERDDT